jgi:DNA primase large subunit
MQFTKKSERRKSGGACEYPCALQLYKLPPTKVLSLQEFEEMAERRLRLLQAVETKRVKLNHEGVHKNTEQFYREMKSVVKGTDTIPLALYQEFDKALTPEDQKRRQGLINKQQEDRRRDHFSHYILRLAYCRTEDMRRWFLTHETELLRCRYITLCNQKDKDDFFKEYENELNFHHQDTSDISESILTEICSFYDVLESDVMTSFIKVPFTAALDLVQSRQVVLKDGYVYVPKNKDEMVLSLVCSKFRARVSEELVKTLHHLSVVDDDERLAPFLKRLKDRYLGEDFSTGTELSGQVHPSQIDALSKESFPPCMLHLHEVLRAEHHLRHFGRLQYGLFLKSIGGFTQLHTH